MGLAFGETVQDMCHTAITSGISDFSIKVYSGLSPLLNTG